MNKRQRKKRGKSRRTETQVEEGSGNVFADLGLPNAEALLDEARRRARRSEPRIKRLRRRG